MRHLYAGLVRSGKPILFMDNRSAEVAKYAENFFLALKVTWANELRDVCEVVGADFLQMMAAVTHDYRIGRSHTHVYPDARGWGWMVKASMNPATPRPLYNKAKEMLLQGKRVNSLTISSPMALPSNGGTALPTCSPAMPVLQ